MRSFGFRRRFTWLMVFYSNNYIQAELGVLGNIGSEILNGARGPGGPIRHVVHDPVDVGAQVALRVVPRVVGVALAGVEVVLHAKAMAHFMCDGLRNKNKFGL